MNFNIKCRPKQKIKLANYFYKNGQIKCDDDEILQKSAECTGEMLETKKSYKLNITSKLADSNSAPKTRWGLLNRLQYNKKIPAIPPFLAFGKFVSEFFEKRNILNNVH